MDSGTQFTSVVGGSEVASLARTSPDDETLSSYLRAFDEHVTQQLGQRADALGAPSRPLDVDLDSVDLQQEIHTVASRLAPIRETTITLRDGCRIVGTPFDMAWATGRAALAFGSKWNGTFSIFGIDGPASAGVAVELTSDSEVDIAITPSGTYDGSWFTFHDARTWRNDTGLGITVYADGDPTPVYSRQVVLWSIRGTAAQTAGAVSGDIAKASSPTASGSFGAYPLAPVFCRLRPGRRLLVWVWGWQVNGGRPEGVWSLLLVRVPAIVVCAAPPIILH